MSAPREEWERLADLSAAAAVWLEGAPPMEVLRWAAREFGDTMCVSSSMTDAVLAHLAARAQPGVPVLFLDTGYHFPETIGTRDAVAATMPVTVKTVQPLWTVAEQDADLMPRLHERDPDRCCWLRKVEPLGRALAPYTAWVSGVRRDESPSRRDTPVVAWDPRRAVVKVHPLATWTQDDVDAYIREHGVLVNPLVSDGYPSLGCAPCTSRPQPGTDRRSGRWAGQEKTECGIHA
ncbi:MAG: phosphoadenylyl-sulfate reductase [Mycobacteriales bacterium]